LAFEEKETKDLKRGDFLTAKWLNDAKNAKTNIIGAGLVQVSKTPMGTVVRVDPDNKRHVALNDTGFALKEGYIVEITDYDSDLDRYSIQRPSASGITNIGVCATDAALGDKVYLDLSGNVNLWASGFTANKLLKTTVDSFSPTAYTGYTYAPCETNLNNVTLPSDNMPAFTSIAPSTGGGRVQARFFNYGFAKYNKYLLPNINSEIVNIYIGTTSPISDVSDATHITLNDLYELKNFVNTNPNYLKYNINIKGDYEVRNGSDIKFTTPHFLHFECQSDTNINLLANFTFDNGGFSTKSLINNCNFTYDFSKTTTNGKSLRCGYEDNYTFDSYNEYTPYTAFTNCNFYLNPPSDVLPTFYLYTAGCLIDSNVEFTRNTDYSLSPYFYLYGGGCGSTINISSLYSLYISDAADGANGVDGVDATPSSAATDGTAGASGSDVNYGNNKANTEFTCVLTGYYSYCDINIDNSDIIHIGKGGNGGDGGNGGNGLDASDYAEGGDGGDGGWGGAMLTPSYPGLGETFTFNFSNATLTCTNLVINKTANIDTGGDGNGGNAGNGGDGALFSQGFSYLGN